MARRMMTREVTKTTVKVGKMEIKDGQLVAISLPDETLLGNVNIQKAQRYVDKKYEKSATVLQVLPETTVYEMPVEEFIKVATVKAVDEEQA